MSSGSVCSGRFSFSLPLRPPFFDPDFEKYGRVILAPLVTGANISLAISFCDLVEGVRKSILKGSFFSRFAFGALPSPVVSAMAVHDG